MVKKNKNSIISNSTGIVTENTIENVNSTENVNENNTKKSKDGNIGY